MIICFEGTPGSGKSYEAVKKIIDNLMLGRTVYTNIDGLDDPVCREHIKSFSGLSDYELSTRLIHLPNWQALEFYKHVSDKSLVVLDEVHKLYNNRNWQKDVNTHFADWSSTHRKSGNDVILVTQNLEKVDGQVRGLVEWTYRFKKLNMLGRLFRNGYKRHSYTEDDTSGKALDVKFYKYNSRFYPCYKSYTNDDIKELNIMEHTNILKHPVFLILPVVLFLAIYMIFFKSSFATGDLFGSKKILSRAGDITKQGQPKVTAVQPQPQIDNKPVSIPSSGKNPEIVISDLKKDSAKSLKPACFFTGYIKAVDVVYTYFNCGSAVKVYKNGVLDFGWNLPTAAALADGGQVQALPSSVEGTDNENFKIKVGY